jgi:hypothetical protein
MRVTIASDRKTETGVSKNGKPFTENFQDAYLHEPGKKYPTSCRVALYDNARPYQQGEYETSQDVEINDFGRLVVRRDLVLTQAAPLAAVDARKQA